MATNVSEKVIYVVNTNATAMAAGFTTAVDGTTRTTVGAQSLATANWHAAQWGVTPVLYQADFGPSSTYSPTDAAMRTHATNVAALIAANPTATHVVCSSHTPGIALTGKWQQFYNTQTGTAQGNGTTTVTITAAAAVITQMNGGVAPTAFPVAVAAAIACTTAGFVGGTWAQPTTITSATTFTYTANAATSASGAVSFNIFSASAATGEAFDAWFGAAKYMQSGTGWTTGTQYAASNDPLIVGPKRYAGCDPNYLPYGRIGHWGIGSFATGVVVGQELASEDPAIIKRVVQDALSQVGSDAIHKAKGLYMAWDTAGGSAEPCNGANWVAQEMNGRRGYSNFQPFNGPFAGYAVPTVPGNNFQLIAGVAASFPNGPVSQTITGPTVAASENATWLAETLANPPWLYGAAWSQTANGFMSWVAGGHVARGAWMLNQSSVGGTNTGAGQFIYNGGCLAQGTVSEPLASNVISYRWCIDEFLKGRTWAESCLVALQRNGTAIGKMGVYGDPLAQHFKLNNATWI